MHKEELKKNIAIISNINFFYFIDNLKKKINQHKINANLNFYNLNDYKILKKNSLDLVIIIIDPLILIEGIEYKENTLGKKVWAEHIKYVESKINEICSFFTEFKNLYFTTFFNYSDYCVDKIFEHLNQNLKKKSKNKFQSINIDNFFKINGIKNIISKRSKLNFLNPFEKKYELYFSDFVFENINFFRSQKKMIIFDCDNTLWRGVAGESKLEELEFDGNTPIGKIFNEVHYIVKSLLKKGVMISVCSKNNLTDVKKVFASDKTILNINDFTSFRINWKNKFENIYDLSKELNIGLNSIIFIDDNSFEINSVKKKLPEVLSFKVPDNLYEYPKFLQKIENLYFSKLLTKEDLIRNKSYEINKVRKSLENKSQNLEKFLNSLKIKINIEKNKYAHLDRIVQMCQRTNQFNFTSKRYFHKDILRMLRDKNYHVFTFDIQDKFGSYGITALLISKTNKSKKQVSLDSFLMSCRVLGKNIHLSIFDFIIKYYRKIGYKNLLVNYIPTQKNILLKQVLLELDFHENNEKNNCIFNIDIERYVKKSKNNFIIKYNG